MRYLSFFLLPKLLSAQSNQGILAKAATPSGTVYCLRRVLYHTISLRVVSQCILQHTNDGGNDFQFPVGAIGQHGVNLPEINIR